MTRSRFTFTRSLMSLLLVCLWLVFPDGTRLAAAQDQPDKTDKPVASEAGTASPAKSTTDTPAATEDDPEQAKRDAKYHEKLETDLQHAVKDQTEAYRELEKRDERFQSYFYIGAGVIGVVLVGLFVLSRVRKK